MATPELINYIKTERTKNIPDEKIREKLRANGWKETDINNGMSTAPSVAGLKEYQRMMRGVLFVISYLGYIVFMATVTGWGLTYDSYSYFVVLGGLIICLASAFIVGSGATPQSSTINTVGDVILKIILVAMFTSFLWFVLFFVWCLYGGMGAMGGL